MILQKNRKTEKKDRKMDKRLLIDSFKKLNINLEESKILQFETYSNMLIETNKVMNLTSITDEDEIVLKHFADSVSFLNEFSFAKSDKVIDVGCGAGFPSMPLKIVNPEVKFTLVDSLNKRINFLNNVVDTLNIKDIELIHSRAEDLGQNYDYRESFDYGVARAVASLNVLCEYLLPFVKVGGQLIALKGKNYENEIKESEKAIELLGGKVSSIKSINIPNTDITHYIVFIDKISNTPKSYPRTSGKATKNPIK